jgi:hypothetical protein
MQTHTFLSQILKNAVYPRCGGRTPHIFKERLINGVTEIGTSAYAPATKTSSPRFTAIRMSSRAKHAFPLPGGPTISSTDDLFNPEHIAFVIGNV